MLVTEYKPEFQFRKSSKDAKFGQCLHLLAPPFVLSRTDAQNGLDTVDSIFNIMTSFYNNMGVWTGGGPGVGHVPPPPNFCGRGKNQCDIRQNIKISEKYDMQ